MDERNDWQRLNTKRLRRRALLRAAGRAGVGIAGLALVYLLLSAGQPIVESQVGLFIPIRPPGSLELLFLGAVVTAGFLMGFVPALKAYRTALNDGLAVRV